MVVANAAYDSNTSSIPVFDETAYHGAVVWYALLIYAVEIVLILLQVMATGFDGGRSSKAARSVRSSERNQRRLSRALANWRSARMVQHVACD